MIVRNAVARRRRSDILGAQAGSNGSFDAFKRSARAAKPSRKFTDRASASGAFLGLHRNVPDGPDDRTARSPGRAVAITNRFGPGGLARTFGRSRRNAEDPTGFSNGGSQREVVCRAAKDLSLSLSPLPSKSIGPKTGLAFWAFSRQNPCAILRTRDAASR